MNEELKKEMDEKGKFFRKKPVMIRAFKNEVERTIPTPEGDHIARVGEMIIEGVHGEFYPCKPDIFQKTYSKTYKKREKKEVMPND